MDNKAFSAVFHIDSLAFSAVFHTVSRQREGIRKVAVQ